ncbi:MAG: ATP phosphoribosyltransferase regulatory subunit [Rhodospirillaceae bacterium]|nr:ATP phosphoribosyltransferase regulatory subunit [Rhodospirillaceae bacterium]|tara:strand:+ start:19103 stop:20263 length:1161 start_codon:yes stop_codon:yes gene_type:complete
MTEKEKHALLPAGLRDVLPDDAAFEADIVERIMAFFGQNGYERVKAPLTEFEDGLLSGAGVALAPQTFRLMDPVSQRMMGVRADITPQIARIARTRLGESPRPLRLSYAGDVLRVRGSQLRPERQILQVGAELIGSGSPLADTEIIILAANAISTIGVDNFSVDLTVPRLVPSIVDQYELSEGAAAEIRAALDRKDPEAVRSVAGPATDILISMLEATGTVDSALDTLKALNLPETAAAERERLEVVVGHLRGASPELQLTLDPAENRGFEYHTGIGFSIFAKGLAGELARGGRYRVEGKSIDEDGERATGVTLYTDTLLGMLPKPAGRKRILVSGTTSRETILRLQEEDWITVSALEISSDLNAEAIRLGCSHILGKTGPEPAKG